MSAREEQATLKKLMKIIYEKEKEIDKYKKQLRDKERNKVPAPHPREGLSSEDKQFITHEIIENRRFLETASMKLHSMENKIMELQADLQEEENRNQILEEQVYLARCECEERQKTINQLRTVKQLLENAKLSSTGEISQKEGRIQCLIIENQKIKIILAQARDQNSNLKQRVRKIENEANKALKFLYKNLRFHDRKNKSNIDINFNFSRVVQPSQHQIKTQTFICEKLQKSVEQKMGEVLELMQKWENALQQRQREWKRNFERGLSQHSFDGISGLISESILLKDEGQKGKPRSDNSNFYDTSVYKRNEEELLKQLEIQCEKSGPASAEKEKLVELSEIKESLKMTKQVNEQLFDELSRQENIIKVFRQTFTNLEKKKLVKLEGSDQFQRLRSVLGVKN